MSYRTVVLIAFIANSYFTSSIRRVAGKDGGRTGMKSEDIAGDLGGPHTGSYKDELNIIASYI